MPEFSFFRSSKSKPDKTCKSCQNNQVATEFAEEYPVFENTYSTKGVSVNTESDRMLIKYDGLLAKSGAKDVYAVVGYGDNQNWDNVKYYQMNSTRQNAFEVVLPISGKTGVNVAFKDGANNWDNNSGRNYIFSSH